MLYKRINAEEYAKKLKIEFLNNPKLWYDAISPKEKADELIAKTKGDYSEIWHEHCDNCWETIDRSTGLCYRSEDEVTWLCEKCFNLLSKWGRTK